MPDDLKVATDGLKADETKAKGDHDWSKFIQHLDADLKDPKLQAKQAELKTQAQALLKDAGFGDVTIDGVQDGKILEHKGGVANAIDNAGHEAALTATTPPAEGTDDGHHNKRDADQKVLSSDSGNSYTYDDKGLKTVSWKGDNDSDQGWVRSDDGKTWTDKATNQAVQFDTPPTIDPKTGDLSYKKTGSNTRIEQANGGTIDLNADGTVDTAFVKGGDKRTFKYDNGKLSEVHFQANGTQADDPKQSWTKKGDHWENGENPPQSRKDITVDPKTGDVTEISADGKKKHTSHTDGTADDADVTAPTQPPPESGKKSLHQRWVEARKQARLDSANDVNTTGKHTIKFGDTMWDIAKASAKKNSSDQHDPKDSEVSAEVDRLVAKYNKDHPDKPITNKNGVPIGTEIDTAPDAPATPQGGANDVKGDKGQTTHYAADDTAHAHPTGVDYANGMKAQIGSGGNVIDITGDPANGGKEYKVVKNPDNTWSKQDASGNALNPPQDYSDVTVNGDGSMKMTSKDKTQVTNINGDGTTTTLHLDGKGTDAANVNGVDYPNGMKAAFAANGDISVTGDPASPGKDYKLVKNASGGYDKQNADGSAWTPPQSYSKAEIDPDSGAITLTSQKDGHDHTTTIQPDGTTAESTDTPPPPTAATADKALVKYDGNGTDPKNLNEIDYFNGVKATVTHAADGSVQEMDFVSATGTSKIVKNADHYDLTPPPKAGDTINGDGVTIDPATGKVTMIGKHGDNSPFYIVIGPDGKNVIKDGAPS